MRIVNPSSNTQTASKPPSTHRDASPAMGPSFRIGPFVLLALVPLASLAIASVSLWLVPPYFLLMAYVLLGRSASTRSVAGSNASRTLETVGSSGRTTREGLADAVKPSTATISSLNAQAASATNHDSVAGLGLERGSVTASPSPQESAAGSPTSARASKRSRAARNRAAKGKSSFSEQQVAWVRIGSGKFVRVELPDPASDSDETATTNARNSDDSTSSTSARSPASRARGSRPLATPSFPEGPDRDDVGESATASPSRWNDRLENRDAPLDHPLDSTESAAFVSSPDDPSAATPSFNDGLSSVVATTSFAQHGPETEVPASAISADSPVLDCDPPDALMEGAESIAVEERVVSDSSPRSHPHARLQSQFELDAKPDLEFGSALDSEPQSSEPADASIPLLPALQRALGSDLDPETTFATTLPYAIALTS